VCELERPFGEKGLVSEGGVGVGEGSIFGDILGGVADVRLGPR